MTMTRLHLLNKHHLLAEDGRIHTPEEKQNRPLKGKARDSPSMASSMPLITFVVALLGRSSTLQAT
jgi:hypothetical protein